MILGLDISTSCTGWCVLSKSGAIADMGMINLSKKKGVYEKAVFTRAVLTEISKKYKVKKVYIEENLQSFRSGFSSAKTLSTLARFNGIVSFISFEIFKTEPVHINVNAARKSLGIKLIRKKDGGKPTKDQVLEWVQSNVEFSWPKKILKSGPRKGQEVNDPGCFDIADAYVITMAGMKMNI
jgi:Holliday junction resolvasome RuvABC endonuclease subunit